MADNLRHAQYRVDGSQIDDPQATFDSRLQATNALDSGANVDGHISTLIKTIFNRDITRGCVAVPRFITYVDPVNGSDTYDGTVGVWTSGTVGPKKTAVVANWAGSPKTSIFSDEILLFKGGTSYTHTEANGRITTTSRKHFGAYYTAQGQAMPVINGTIYASGNLTDISIQGLKIVPTTANQSSIFFQQTASGQAVRRVTIRGCDISGGTIDDSTSRGGLQVQYFNAFSSTDEYLHCNDILVAENLVSSTPGHGIFFGGAVGAPVGQVNGTALLTATGNFANTETVTIAGIVFTAVTVIGATAGNFLIGADKGASLANLAALINAPATTSATQVALSATNQTVATNLGLKATVSGRDLKLELTAFYATAFLAETAGSAFWSINYIATEQIWGGVDVINNIVQGCGAQMDCHGLSSYSAGVLLGKTSLTWTSVTGTIYYTSLSAAALYGYSVPSVDIVTYDTGSGTELFKTVPAYCDPTLLQPGEHYVDVGNQRLYVNANIVLNSSTRLNICTRAAKGIRWLGNKVSDQKFNNILGGSAIEGHLVAFDDFTSYCMVANSDLNKAAGAAITINRGDRNIIVGTYAKDFKLGCVKGNFGWGNIIAKSCFVFDQLGSSYLGYSDTVPGFRGYLHMASASTRLGVSSNDATSWYSNIISDVDLVWNGSATGVSALLGPTSGNSPPVMANHVTISGTASMVPQSGRVIYTPTIPLLKFTSLPLNTVMY